MNSSQGAGKVIQHVFSVIRMETSWEISIIQVGDNGADFNWDYLKRESSSSTLFLFHTRMQDIL